MNQRKKDYQLRTVNYTIPITPIAWKRAGSNGKRFFDQQVHDKIRVGIDLISQHNDQQKFIGPLHMDIKFIWPIPESIKRRSPSIWHVTVPDIDNCIKFILDTIGKTGTIWTDDRIVCSLNAVKIWGPESSIDITIRELE